MEEALVARLLADTSIASLAKTIVWGVRPQSSSIPAIVLSAIAAGRAYTFKGAAGLHGTGVQFDIWARKYGEADAVYDALLNEMEAPTVTSGVEFGMAFLERKANGSEDVPGLGVMHRISADFTVWWKKI